MNKALEKTKKDLYETGRADREKELIEILKKVCTAEYEGAVVVCTCYKEFKELLGDGA